MAYSPVPGSALYDEHKEKGLILPGATWDHFDGLHVVSRQESGNNDSFRNPKRNYSMLSRFL